MWIFDRKPVKLVIDMEPGLYNFENNSGTGKSYLTFLCKQYNRLGEPVDGYDYPDFEEGRKVPSDVKLLVVDRYDMFMRQIDKEIFALSEKAIVIVDAKTAVFSNICYLDYKAADLITLDW